LGEALKAQSPLELGMILHSQPEKAQSPFELGVTLHSQPERRSQFLVVGIAIVGLDSELFT